MAALVGRLLTGMCRDPSAAAAGEREITAGRADTASLGIAAGPRIGLMSPVMYRALREAIRLGHAFAGPAHIVLALLDEDHPSVAQEVLRANNIGREQIEESAHREHRHDDEGVRGATAGPLWHETAGRAQGFAATLGTGAGDAEHVLLALLWQPEHRWLADVLASADTSREAVVAALAARGVALPRHPPSQLRPPKTQVAAFPKNRANDLNWALRRSAPELNWGIGRDPEDEGMNVVLAAADVDLATVLDDVVGTGAWTWRRKNASSQPISSS